MEKTMTLTEGRWIRTVLQRQRTEGCTIEKKQPIDNDPKVYYHKDNALDEEEDVDLDTESARRLEPEDEQVGSFSADKTRRNRPKGTKYQNKDKNVFTQQNKKT